VERDRQAGQAAQGVVVAVLRWATDLDGPHLARQRLSDAHVDAPAEAKVATGAVDISPVWPDQIVMASYCTAPYTNGWSARAGAAAGKVVLS
jgi:hypothetical protein